MTYQLAFIGAGNMAEAILSGLLKTKSWKATRIMVTDVRAEQLKQFRKKYHVHVSPTNLEAVKQSEIILLAVKPQMMQNVLAEIGPHLRSSQLVVSIAAGIPIQRIEKMCSAKVPVVRVMPNTPALISEGAAGVARGKWATPAHEKKVIQIFKAVGTALAVPEKLMDAVTALSGSGPAYVFYLAEAMKAAGVQNGLSAEQADQLVRQTLKGASLLLSQSSESAEVLRQRVTSPGGTTERAIQFLDTQHVKKSFQQAIRAARQRAQELSRIS